MADLSDVENALVTLILASATGVSNNGPALGGYPARIYRGTAPVTALSVDRATGVCDVIVFPVPNTTRNTTRWGLQTSVVGIAGGLTAAAEGQTANFTGMAVGGELAGLLVNGQPFVYACSLGDNADLIAAALADLVRATQICWVTGSAITIPGASTLIARTAGVAQIQQELGRQEQDFSVTVWAPTPQIRDAVCGALSVTLAQVSFLPLPDGTGGRLRYVRTASFDGDQTASIYRRELQYSVEYPTTTLSQLPVVLFGDSDCNAVMTFV